MPLRDERSAAHSAHEGSPHETSAEGGHGHEPGDGHGGHEDHGGGMHAGHEGNLITTRFDVRVEA